MTGDKAIISVTVINLSPQHNALSIDSFIFWSKAIGKSPDGIACLIKKLILFYPWF